MSDMTYERTSVYGFEETVTAVADSAAEAGFSVLVTHDLRSRFEAKEIEWHHGLSIVEVCKAGYASKMAAIEPHYALHLPCPVVVREDADGQVFVAMLRQTFVAGLFPGEEFGDGPASVEAELRSIVDHATS